jgi:hypothetical protein
MENVKNDKVTISRLKLIELESEAVHIAIANKDNPLNEESIRASQTIRFIQTLYHLNETKCELDLIAEEIVNKNK